LKLPPVGKKKPSGGEANVIIARQRGSKKAVVTIDREEMSTEKLEVESNQEGGGKKVKTPS